MFPDFGNLHAGGPGIIPNHSKKSFYFLPGRFSQREVAAGLAANHLSELLSKKQAANFRGTSTAHGRCSVVSAKIN